MEVRTLWSSNIFSSSGKFKNKSIWKIPWSSKDGDLITQETFSISVRSYYSSPYTWAWLTVLPSNLLGGLVTICFFLFAAANVNLWQSFKELSLEIIIRNLSWRCCACWYSIGKLPRYQYMPLKKKVSQIRPASWLWYKEWWQFKR